MSNEKHCYITTAEITLSSSIYNIYRSSYWCVIWMWNCRWAQTPVTRSQVVVHTDNWTNQYSIHVLLYLSISVSLLHKLSTSNSSIDLAANWSGIGQVGISLRHLTRPLARHNTPKWQGTTHQCVSCVLLLTNMLVVWRHIGPNVKRGSAPP